MSDRDGFTLDDANELRRVVGASIRAIRSTEDTPDGQTETLGFLARDGAQSIAALARLRHVRHQTMSAVVAELEARGLVVRSPDPMDARGVLIALTGDGAAAVADLRVRRSAQLLAAAEAVLTPAERAILIEATGLLERVVIALQAEPEE